MRALFALLGLLTFAPPALFLALFRPPGKFFPHRNNEDGWWIGAALRLLALALAAVGFRVFVGSMLNIEHPVIFVSWVDSLTAVITLTLAATASVLFVAVYLFYRNWEA